MLALLDLEELVQRCRGANARIYIREAIDCYRIGAYRACVITTWIAVVYDLIDKLREIGIHGDAAATKLVTEFDRIQKEDDLEAALRFEREILGVAKSQFELISGQETLDLERLFKDRNRCGHPNLRRDDEAYAPPPELARLHLRNAIEHVLERPPVQGKAALTNVWSTVKSEYFPTAIADAKAILTATPLSRAKRNLIREFISGLLTSLMREELTEKQFSQRIAAARATQQLHVAEVEKLLAERFDQFVFRCEDKNLSSVLRLLSLQPDYEPLLQEPCKVRLRTFVTNLTSDGVSLLTSALKVPFLREVAAARLLLCPEPEMLGIASKLEAHPTDAFIDKCVAIYAGAHNFNHANILAVALIGPLIRYASKAQLTAILGSVENSQVRFSNQFPDIIKAVVGSGNMDKEEARAVLIGKGLQEVADQHLPV